MNPDAADTRDATVYLIAKTLQLATERNPPRQWISLTAHNNYKTVPLPWHSSVPRDQQRGGGDYFHCEMYQHFANLLAGKYDDPKKALCRSNLVITFNYDVVLDEALKKAGISPAYGLADDANEKGVPLLKLHGSTNWVVCTGCRKPSVWQEAATSLFPFGSIQCKHCGKSDWRLLLVPPSWDKSEYQDIMRPVWARAVKELKAATRICIIGYSMPASDSFFRYLLALGLAENHQLYKLIVVDYKGGRSLSDFGVSSVQQDENPAEETVQDKYRRILARLFAKRRFDFDDQGFEMFLRRGANNLLNRGETIAML